MKMKTSIPLKSGQTYRSFVFETLASLPTALARHYRQKVAKFLAWWKRHGTAQIPDAADPKLESAGKAPSWRRVAKVLATNDFWCNGIGFQKTKNSNDLALFQQIVTA
jgi:predicted phosphoadenosine phosphosulfate sulfurtransferase